MVLSTYTNNSVRIGNDMTCAASNTEEPIMGSEDVELVLLCNDTGIRTVELCLTLSDQPFLVGNGTYYTLSLQLQKNCTGMTPSLLNLFIHVAVLCYVAVGDNTEHTCTAGNEILGLYCLTLRQSEVLFNSRIGMWHTLVSKLL